MKKQILVFIALMGLFSQAYAKTQAPKKFKRAIIIAGGGIAPGVGLGIIAGAKEMGWNPDVVITTCGGSMSAAITNSFSHSSAALDFAKGPKFFEVLNQISIDTKSIFDMQNNFKKTDDLIHINNYFKGNVLALDDKISGFLPNPAFRNIDSAPRVIMLAAKANFKVQDIGSAMTHNRFTQVYFTDPETAKLIDRMNSPIKNIFPDSYLSQNIEVISDATTEQAARASISDPYLINPGNIKGDYYFTGAVDLIPIELALEIAEEVLVTYPTGLFVDYEIAAVESTFGFNQTTRVLHAIQHQGVKWIDLNGKENTKFDPAPSISLKIKNNIPKNPKDFSIGIQKQYDFGFKRVQEALTVQANSLNVRTHLREPINPKLLTSFTCDNANKWKTAHNTNCSQEFWPGCSRQEPSCVPIR